jgi:AmmeMemoRadiSam system protein A/AmmeMemoRadiSam system protein B
MPLSAVYAVPHPPLLIPEIGLGDEQEISNTFRSMEQVGREIADIAPDTIIVISPHAPHMNDRFVLSASKSVYGDMRRFHAPSVSLRKDIDIALATRIYTESLRKAVPVLLYEEDDLFIDHGALVPLYFIEKYYQNYRLILISLSELSADQHYSLGKCIAKAASASLGNVVLIASGDLSHRLKEDGPYGYAKEGPIFDQKVTELLREGHHDEIRNIDPEISEPAGECGLRSLIIMSGALGGQDFTSDFMSYEGPFGVGYAVCSFHLTDEGSDPVEPEADTSVSAADSPEVATMLSDPYVALAKKTLEEYVKTDRIIAVPEALPPEMIKARAGVFVSLKMNGQLRGCIGTIAATTGSIAQEIIRNAIESGTEDPRFEPVKADELEDIEYSVDVLGPAEPIKDKTELDPVRYGVIVSHKGRRGLLLPNLEGVDTVDFQLSIALSKAGIPSSAEYSIERFEVIRHK